MSSRRTGPLGGYWRASPPTLHSRAGPSKAGTCLRKRYYETYRFSEDLDFTVLGSAPEAPEHLAPIFAEISTRLAEHAGLELVVD